MLFSKSGEKYHFSVIINNHRGSALAFRKEIESLISDFIESH